jgi:hypothetical protein
MADSEFFPTQISLLEASITPAVSAAVDQLSASGEDKRGAVFTRREVVDFILDLVEYTLDKPLHKMRLLEPAFGNGDFLLPAVERLLKAYRKHSKAHSDVVSDLKDAIRAVELHRATFQATRRKLKSISREQRQSLQSGLGRGQKHAHRHRERREFRRDLHSAGFTANAIGIDF